MAFYVKSYNNTSLLPIRLKIAIKHLLDGLGDHRQNNLAVVPLFDTVALQLVTVSLILVSYLVI